MKHCIVEDSSFIVATMDKKDALHKDAVFIFKKIWENREKIKIIVPPLGLYEVIVTLSRKGIAHNIIEQKILNLLHIKEVIITSITETSAFKHCKNILSVLSQEDALRNSDFLITSLAMDYEAQILTFDKTMYNKVRPHYDKIYYCSSKTKKDDSQRFLDELKTAIGGNELDIKDIPF